MIRRLWKKGWIPALVILGAGLYLLKVSWLKWGSLLIDTGRELYVPTALISGKLLYRDIFYEFGPFSPYLNALLCTIFSVHIRSFIISGALTVTAMCALTYRISRIFLNRALSTLSVITFLFVFAFSQHYEAGIFNYIIPYSYPSTHSIALALAALFFYYRGRPWISGLFAVLTLIARIEIGLAVAVSVFIAIILDAKKEHRLKAIWVHCLSSVFAAAVIYVFFIAIAKTTVSNRDLLLINLDIKGPLTGETLGTIELWKNMAIILKTVLYYTIASAVFFGGAWIVLLVRNQPSIKRYLAGISLALFIAAATIFFQRNFFGYDIQYRCAPIICISLFIIGYRRYLKGGEKRDLFLSVFSIFSLLLLMRMLFNVRAEHSGFYLLVPGMLCYYVFFLKVIPETAPRREMRDFYRVAFTVLSISFIVSHTAVSLYMYKARSMEISSSRGTMAVRPGYYRCRQLLDYLREKADPSAALVVFPEGLALNFLSQRGNPLRHYAFLPLLFKNPEFEKSIIEGLEDNGIEHVVVLRRLTSEYGAARFGIDYAQGIMRYLINHYAIERQFGPWPFTSNEFSVALLKRKK